MSKPQSYVAIKDLNKIFDAKIKLLHRRDKEIENQYKKAELTLSQVDQVIRLKHESDICWGAIRILSELKMGFQFREAEEAKTGCKKEWHMPKDCQSISGKCRFRREHPRHDGVGGLR